VLRDLKGNVLPSGRTGQDEIVAMLPAGNDDPEPFPAEATRFAPSAAQRNRVLAFALFSVVASIFALVVTLTVVLHYAEAHHLLASL
jgi:hypothetical protein